MPTRVSVGVTPAPTNASDKTEVISVLSTRRKVIVLFEENGVGINRVGEG